MLRQRPRHTIKPVHLGLIWCVLFNDLNKPACAISNGNPVPKDDPINLVTVSLYGAHEDCTGVKIASNLVLTARHCNLDKSTRAIFPDGSSHNIIQRFVPNANRNGHKNLYDLALLTLAENISGPVALIADEAPRNGSIGWIAGYGGKKLTSTDNPLRKLPVQVVDRNYSSSAAIVRTLSGGAVCDGDSGGPGYTVVHGTIVVWGIDSASLGFSTGCSSREIYVNVTSKRDWITTIIAGSH